MDALDFDLFDLFKEDASPTPPLDEPIAAPAQPKEEPQRSSTPVKSATADADSNPTESEAEEAEDSDNNYPPLNRENIAGYIEMQTIRNAPALCRKLYPALLGLVEQRDKDAIKLVAEILGLVKKGGGVNIIQNVATIGASGLPSDGGDSGPRGFESIIRVLEVRDSAMLPSGPMMAAPDFSQRGRLLSEGVTVEPVED